MNVSRKTKTLSLILDLFNKEDYAVPVVDLVSTFKDNMNKTTVYRILNRLENAGILHSFMDKDGLKRYAKGDQRLHPHFLCEDCGISTCLPLKINPPSLPNYTIKSSEQLYLGQCKDCQ